MNKKKVSFVQPNFQQGPRDLNAFYLPYSIGVLWSYALQSQKVKENYELDCIIWRRDPIATIVEQLASNDIVAFSTYVWNHQYNYKLAAAIKKFNPNVITIFGGPEPAISDPDFFKKNPFIDIVVKLEGEITFTRILENIDNSIDHIPGLLINKNLEAVDTGIAERVSNLGDVPSPYVSGVFDKLIDDNPGIVWNVVLETNRGCPYACTFCDWGSLTYNKVKKFDLDRVFAEIEWFSEKKCDWVNIADANFGMFYERDSMIIDKFIEVQNRNGYPRNYIMAWAKNQKREVIDLVKRLRNTSDYSAGLTVAIQSLNETVLDISKRRNMEINRLEEMFELCEKNNIPLYTELIRGLPGETAESWRENFWRLFRSGNHHGITVYQAQMIENAEMNLLQRKIHNIKTVTIPDYFSNSFTTDLEINECIEIVASTNQMPTDKMIESAMFTWFVNTFHIDGVSTFLSRFVAKYCGVDYSEFYKDLRVFLQSDAWYAAEQQEMQQYYTKWFTTGVISHPDLAGMRIKGINLAHRTLLKIHIDNKYDHVYNLLETFMQRYNIDQDLISDLILLQQNYLVVHDKIDRYPLNLSLKHNVYEYIVFGQDLERRSTQHILEFTEDKDITFQNFIEKLYFARRGNFGKATIRVVDEK